MERTIKQIDYQKLDEILEVLYKYRGSGRVSVANAYKRISKDDSDYVENDWRTYCHDLKSLGLAENFPDSGSDMRILDLGQKVLENGGWLKHQAILKEKDEKEYSLRLRAVEASEDASDSAKKSVRIAWIASTIALISLFLMGLQYIDSKETNEALEVLKKRLNKIEIQLKPQPKAKELWHSNKVLKAN